MLHIKKRIACSYDFRHDKQQLLLKLKDANNLQHAWLKPANFFWDISVRFLSWAFWDFCRRHDHFRRFPKKSEVFRRRPKSAEVCQRRARSQCFSLQKSEIARKVLPFIHFTHGFRSLHGSELTYFWKLCQARRQQLTFFNQAWEIGPQAWAGVRSKFSTRRRENWQVYLDGENIFAIWLVGRLSVDRLSSECRPLYRPISRSTLPTVNKIRQVLAILTDVG